MNAGVDLSFEDFEAVADQECELAFERLTGLVTGFEALVAAGKVVQTLVDGEWRWLQWEAVATAYRHLRSLYVRPRKVPKKKLKVDPTLQCWAEERADFVDGFYGKLEADGKRQFRGVDPEVADVIQRYQRLQQKWHQRTPEYRAQRRKSDKQRGVNKTESAKDRKEKWRLSPAGQAWWEAQAQKRKDAAAKRKAAKLAAKAGAQ